MSVAAGRSSPRKRSTSSKGCTGVESRAVASCSPPAGAPARARRRRDARVPGGYGRDSGRRLGGSRRRRGSGRPSVSRSPGRRAQDDDQRAELGREGLYGRFRGCELADLGERRRGSARTARRDRAHDHDRGPDKATALNAETGDAPDAPARLAPGRAASRGRRRAGVGAACRLRPRIVFHNGHEQLARGIGPYFYLPKIESHRGGAALERRVRRAQDELGIPHGTIRATVLIETILAAFEMDEILYELRDHACGVQRGALGLHFQRASRSSARPRASCCRTARR